MEPLFSELKTRLEAVPPRAFHLPGVVLRESAVIVPLFLRGGEPWLVFEQRPEAMRQHGGQMAFPGGSRDAGDPTPLHTALRELREELGIRPESVEVLGRLDELPTLTEFRIVPFVGAIPPEVRYQPSPEEVAEVVEVPFAWFRDAHARTEQRQVRAETREVYFYDYGPHVIWGATARIVRNLLEVTRELPSFRR